MQGELRTRDISHTLGTSADKQCASPGDSPWCSALSWSRGGINTLEVVSWLVSFQGWGSDRWNDPRDHLQQTAGTDDRTHTRRSAGELSACKYCSRARSWSPHRPVTHYAMPYCFTPSALRPPDRQSRVPTPLTKSVFNFFFSFKSCPFF